MISFQQNLLILAKFAQSVCDLKFDVIWIRVVIVIISATCVVVVKLHGTFFVNGMKFLLIQLTFPGISVNSHLK